MKNWKTTLAGALAAAGAGMIAFDDPTVKTIGQVLAVIGAILLGLFSKDMNVTGGVVVQPSTEEAKIAVLNPTAPDPAKTEGDQK